MEKINENLRTKSARSYYVRTLLTGVRNLGDSKKRKEFLALLVLICAAVAALVLYMPTEPVNMRSIAAPIYLGVGLIAVLAAVYAIGRVPGGHAIYDNLIRAGFVNGAYEAPVPIQMFAMGESVTAVVFHGKGFPLEQWLDAAKLPTIATALGMEIVDIRPGRNNREIVVYGVRSHTALPDKASWKMEYLPEDEAVLALGQSLIGQATVDLGKTVHILVGATTGGGKTTLLKSLIRQMAAKGYVVHITDRKGMVDYGGWYRRHCTYSETDEELLDAMQQFHQVIEERKAMLADDEHVSNIREYNATHDVPWNRWVLIVDEASMVMDATGLDAASKKVKQQIIGELTELARLGRAFGVHLVICTQRPSVESVPGALKAQLDARIAGHMADAASSEVILGDGSAAKLPAIPGRFLLRNAGGLDQVFQAYFVEED